MDTPGFASPASNIREAVTQALLCATDPEAALKAFEGFLWHLEDGLPVYETEMREINDAIGIRRALWLNHFIQPTKD